MKKQSKNKRRANGYVTRRHVVKSVASLAALSSQANSFFGAAAAGQGKNGNYGSITWNLGSPVDWLDNVFINIAKQSRGWQNRRQPVTKEFDLDMAGESGRQTRRFVFSTRDYQGSIPDRPTHRDGNYTVRWEGGTGTRIASGSASRVKNLRQSKQSATFDVVEYSGNLSLVFRGFDAKDPPRNVQIFKTLYRELFDGGEIFDPLFISVLRDAAYEIRFMDWMGTNDSEITNLSDYPIESWQRWKPVPLSICIKLCNELDCHGWFNIPHMATEEFALSMFQELENSLSTEKFADIEYSNEIWNRAFDQKRYFESQSIEEWGVSGSPSDGRAWAGMRFVRFADLANTVSQNRFRFIICGQRGADGSSNDLLDAPIWREVDPANYIAPHKKAEFYACTDYIGRPQELSDVMAAFDSGYDQGAIQNSKELLWDYFGRSTEERKQQVTDQRKKCFEQDTVQGASRRLRFRTYEGGSQHIHMTGERFARWYKPLAWVSGVRVVKGDYRVNRHGRLFEAANGGTTGGNEPLHKDQRTVSDGQINWIDRCGVDSFMYRDVTGSLSARPKIFPLREWSEGQSVEVDDYYENAFGRIFRATNAGRTDQNEPVHSQGVASDGTVDWEAIECGLGERNPRPEVRRFFMDVMYSEEMAGFNVQMFEHLKSLGGESPAVFQLQGGLSSFGQWGKFFHYADTGKSRVGEIGDVLRDWSIQNPAWWRD